MKNVTGLIAPLLLLLGAIALRFQDPLPVQLVRNLVFDSYQRMNPRPYDPGIPVRIGDIDEKSLETYGQWPWSRAQMALIVDRLRELGAAAIALDVLMVEPDRTAPRAVAANLPLGDDFTAARKLMATLPDPDQALAEAIARIPTVVPFALLSTDPRRPQELPLAKAGFAFAGDDPRDLVQRSDFLATSLGIFQRAAAGVGSVNTEPDFDGIIRRVPLFVRVPDPDPQVPFRGALATEALRVAYGETTYAIKSTGASEETSFGGHSGITKVKIGQQIVPTAGDGSILVYDTGHQPERFFSLADIMAPGFDAGIVAGRIIFIGTSVEGLRDLKPTILDPVMAGVEIHAQITEQILSGVYLNRPDWASGAEAMALLIFGIVLALLARRRAALSGLVVAVVAIGGSFATSYYLFSTSGILLDPLYPAGTAFLIFVASTVFGFIRTEREKAHVRGAFSRYLSPVLVDQLSQHPERLKLGGELRELSIMFCDIRGFTKLSEGLDPQRLTAVINSFLTPMTRVIQARQGTIDKYIGDCIMAFWNAPIDVALHARMAILAAFDMRQELLHVNARFAEEATQGGTKPIEIRIGIGINTGTCCVGNMGSEQRFDYSVLGDTVNTASRLESLSPAYFVDLVIGEETAAAAEGMALLEIDQVRVKGKNLPVRIFTGLGDADTAGSNSFVALKGAHDAMLSAYRGQDWDAASAALDRARGAAPGHLAGFYGMYAARIAHFREAPPQAGWDGVYVATTKGG